MDAPEPSAAPDPVVHLSALFDDVAPALYAFAVGALLVETAVMAARRPDRDKRSRWLGIKCGALAFGVEHLVHVGLLAGLQLAVYQARIFDLGFGLAAFAVCFLVNDLMFYVSHRMQHRVRVLWAVHVVHHSPRHYDLTTGLRGSVLGGLVHLPFYVWIPLLGVHPVVFLLSNTLFKFVGLAYHTEAVGKLGLLERVLVTPSHHRVHHATNPRYLDRNFGGLFIVFDKLFGSFEPEGEPPVYGLTKDWHGYGLVDCQVHELRDLLCDVRAAPTLRAKLGYLLRPPGWRPDGTGQDAEQLRAEALPLTASRPGP